MSVERQLPEAVRARVAEAVRRAERLSRGRIVPAVVERSDSYSETRVRGGLLLAAVATGIVLALRLPLHLSELVLLQFGAGIVGALLPYWSAAERLLAGQRGMEEAVRARAVRTFHEEGLQRSEEGTGVLVFASLFERRAAVIGGHGIHQKIGDEEWSRALAALLAGLEDGDPGQGFVDAVALCGARLAQHFPRDPNVVATPTELEDAIRVER